MRMINKLILAGFAMFISISIFGQDILTQHQDPTKLESLLVMDQKWVPFPSYTDRNGWDVMVGNNKESLIKKGESKLNYEWKAIPVTSYLEFERTGNRNIMQDPNDDNTSALSDLVVAELAEGKGRFIDQIINGVFFQCERTSWVLSAHLGGYQSSKRAIPDHNDPTIDLGSGDLAGLLAWTYYFLHNEFDKVDPIISARLYKELYDKVIIPYRSIDRFWWMGFNENNSFVNNWNPWCNFNVLQCALLLENDPEQLSKDVFRTMCSVDKFINYVNTDGACEEGPSYWGHAAGKLYDYLKVLSLGTGGKLDFFNNQLVQNMGEYISNSYVGNDWVVNFADASAKFASDAALIYRYGDAIDNQVMREFASYLVNERGAKSLSSGLDMFRVLESLEYDHILRATKGSHQMDDIIEYPETQFYYIKNKEGFFLACKGGHNAESHNHNDIGTVSLYYNSLPILIDAGVGTYTRQTFSGERYSIWTMRSQYHNLPSINGMEQVYGRERTAKNIQFDKKKKKISIDISNAYPAKAMVDSWKRSYSLLKNGIEITDEFQLSEIISENKVHFMLWGNIDINTPGKVLINVDGSKFVLEYDAKQFAPELETIELPDHRLSNVWGDEIFRLTLTAKIKEPKGTYKFKVVLN